MNLVATYQRLLEFMLRYRLINRHALTNAVAGLTPRQVENQREAYQHVSKATKLAKAGDVAAAKAEYQCALTTLGNIPQGKAGQGLIYKIKDEYQKLDDNTPSACERR